MPLLQKEHSSQILTTAFERLSRANAIEAITQIVAETARQLSGADGTTFVLRDGDLCYYVDENSVSPLWKGQRFPMQNCISGWSMLHQDVVVIPDIYQDSRIPHDAYRPTFVKSLCMVPIRNENPLGVIGNYWADPAVPTDDEIKSLQVLANSTAIAIENLELQNQLSRQNATANELKSRTHELELALHAMAHDLRTPVSGMVGLAELLRMRVGNVDGRIGECIQAIIATGRNATSQIERMLLLYRATNGTISKQNIDLAYVAREAIDLLSEQVRNRTVEFRVAPQMRAYADLPLMRVVLGNLLSNAIKYSAKKPQAMIEVGLKNGDRDSCTFFVRDNGEGFDPAKADQLFQPLRRLHAFSEFDGTGLGLVSVAKIIELHGGQCRAEGRPAEGATIYFSLPTHNT